MKCPKCGKEMIVKKEDTSHDTKRGKQYDRTVNVCKDDDLWITVEIPKEK